MSTHRISTNVRSITRPLIRAASTVAYGVAPGWTSNAIRATFAPRPFPTRPHHQALLDRAEPFAVTANGRELRGWQWGEGPPVLLSHGWGTRGIHLHRFVEPLTAAGFQVVAYDNPAHGESEGRHTSAVEFQKAFDAVRARYPHAAAMVGHSMGGVAALRHAAATPLPVVLISPMYRLREGLTEWAVSAGLAAHVFHGLVRRIEVELELALDPISPHRLAPGMRAPVMILHDHHDGATSIQEIRQLAAALPASQLVETHGLGHNGILRTPALIDRAVGFIVREHAGGNPAGQAPPVRRGDPIGREARV